MRKLVEWDDIVHVYDKLWDLLPITIGNPRAYESIKRLIKHIEDNIAQYDKENLNELKRDVYWKINNAESEDDRQRWYEVYQCLKTMGNDREDR